MPTSCLPSVKRNKSVAAASLHSNVGTDVGRKPYLSVYSSICLSMLRYYCRRPQECWGGLAGCFQSYPVSNNLQPHSEMAPNPAPIFKSCYLEEAHITVVIIWLDAEGVKHQVTPWKLASSYVLSPHITEASPQACHLHPLHHSSYTLSYIWSA